MILLHLIFEHKMYLGFSLILLLIGFAPHILAEEEEEEEEREDLILSKFSSSIMSLVTDDESDQWTNSFENEIDSLWEHEIEIKSLNNGHDLFFLISWEDDTKSIGSDLDGLLLVLETKEIEKPKLFEEIEDEEDEEEYETINTTDTQVTVTEETWMWNSDGTTSPEISVNSKWENNKWNVVLEKKSIVDEIGEIEMGKKTEVFLKVAVWDGNQKQLIDDQKENIPEFELLVLPEINSQPSDIYVWSAILAVGTGSFLVAEIKKHQKVTN